jgi:hypothetical protein
MCDTTNVSRTYKMLAPDEDNLLADILSMPPGFITPPRRNVLDMELDNEVDIANSSNVTELYPLLQNSCRPPSRAGFELSFPEYASTYGSLYVPIFPEFPNFSDGQYSASSSSSDEMSLTSHPSNEDRICWCGICPIKDGVEYHGDHNDGSRNGFGTMTCNDGYSYSGYWLKNKRHGEGTETLADGTIYDGDWDNDIKSGWGTTTYLDGTEHKGDWKNGVKCGWGRIQYSPTKSKLSGRIYAGQWRTERENLHGKGEIIYPNGDAYNGEWMNDMRHGRGIHHMKNGDIYIATWEEDEPVFGDIVYSDGTRSTGIKWKSISSILRSLEMSD